MENAKTFKTIIYLLAGILAFIVALLFVMIRPITGFVLVSLLVILVVNIYLVAVSLSLLKLLESQKTNPKP